MSKISSFDGDLDDQEQVRAKLAEVEEGIAEAERALRAVEDELERLERLREGLLVIVGDKEAETDAARTAREEKDQRHREMLRRQLEEAREVRDAAKPIQRQVENLVNASGRPVTANDLLAHLPPDTKQTTVNWALWHAHTKNRILRVSQGLYAPLPADTWLR